MMKILSLGWGVQSFTLAAMVALGELEPIDVAIHSDTTHDSKLTYKFAEKWTPWLQERGVKVITVQDKTGRVDDIVYPARSGRKFLQIPAYFRTGW